MWLFVQKDVFYPSTTSLQNRFIGGILFGKMDKKIKFSNFLAKNALKK